MEKAHEVAGREWPKNGVPHLVIGADTVVELDDCILEKPADAADAHRMLSRSKVACMPLSSSQHSSQTLCTCTPIDAKKQRKKRPSAQYMSATFPSRLSASVHQVHTGVALIVPPDAGAESHPCHMTCIGLLCSIIDQTGSTSR
jgi:predicted house-cleaning NTP pyrophosphatase (Maf/HAM1 superfamily)